MRYRSSETDSWLHRGTQNHKENPCTSSKAFPQDHETIRRNKFWMSSFPNGRVDIQNSLPLTSIKVPAMRPRFTCPQGHFSAADQAPEHTALGHEVYSPEDSGTSSPRHKSEGELWSQRQGSAAEKLPWSIQHATVFYSKTNISVKPLSLRILKPGGLEAWTAWASVGFSSEFRNPFPVDVSNRF